MNMFGPKKATGLDIGSAAVKAVCMSLKDGVPVLTGVHRLDARAEGILDLDELYHSMAEWLTANHLAKQDVILNLPQDLATTQISDFAPGASDAALEEMVGFETAQLAGISDQRFVYDYHQMEPRFGRRNPVLIGICLENMVRERMVAIQQASVRVAGITMGGVAALNALFHLHPEVVAATETQVVIDIGRETSTVMVAIGGQPLFAGSLLFGLNRYVQGLMSGLDLSEEDAEARLSELEIRADDPLSVGMQVSRQLENEFRNALEHWRAQEREEAAAVPLGGIWLCGGGALVDGLPAFIESRLEIPVHIFGPENPETGTRDPTVVTALGLALHGLEADPVHLSMTPPEMRWAAHRDRRFIPLVAACVCVCLLVAAMFARGMEATARALAEVQAEEEQLRQCEAVIPKLQDSMRDLDRYEAALLPYVEYGGRARRFIDAIQALDQVRGGADWFVYVADEESYQEGKNRDTGRSRSGDRGGNGLLPPAATVGIGDTVRAPEFPTQVLAQTITPTPSLIVAGYTPFSSAREFEAVRELRRKLNETEAYTGTDILAEAERVGREDIFLPWVRLLAAELPGTRFKAFTLRVPFSELRITPPDTGDDKKDDE